MKQSTKNKIEEFTKYTDMLRDFLQEYYSLTKSDLCKSLKYLRDEYDESEEPKKQGGNIGLII